MSLEKAVLQDVVLDLTGFQLIRAGRPVKLEKIPLEVLTLLVRKRGALVTRDEIVHAIWGEAVHVDVDSGINTAIRKIRQALEDDPTTPQYLETVVGKGYRFVGEITVLDDGAPRIASDSASGAEPKKRRPPVKEIRAALIIGAALATLILLAIAAAVRRDPTPTASPQSRVVLAVVPLQNLSGNPTQDYFADGLTDEILTQLGELNPDRLGVVKYGLSAAAQRSSVATSNPVQPPGLQYFLEGSVRRQEGTARISVRLLRAVDKTTVWTESFDRNEGDVLLLQSEIAERIGHELQIQVLGRANPKPVKPEVAEAYLRGRFEMSRLPVSDAARAFFESAIAQDPSYAPAVAGLADFYRSRAVQKDEGSDQAWRLAEQNADQALKLDPYNAEAHSAMAQIKLMHDWDWKAAREHALRALQLNPSSPDAHAVYARYLRTAGNMAEAVSQRKNALALDPFRFDLKVQLGLEYYFAHDFQSAAALARESMAFDPEFAHGALCFDLGHMKIFDQAAAECIKSLPLDGHADWVPGYKQAYREGGYQAANRYFAKRTLADVLNHPQPDLWDLANAYAAAGMPGRAIRVLFHGLESHEPGLLQLRVDPDLDSIRDDPRYAELVTRIRFPSE
jgi:TolB-like protein/DNA-binding winged helix-turn-helix (wHTH) protein